MKRTTKIFSLIIATIMVFAFGLNNVNAIEDDLTYGSGASYGITVEKSTENTIEGTMETYVYITLTSGTFQSTTLSYTLINSTLTDIQAITPFAIQHNSQDQTVEVAATDTFAANTKVAMVKFVTKKNEGAENCGIEITNDGKEYKVVEEKTPTPENPKTGSITPVAALVGGVALVAILYVNSRRSTKMYRI